MGAVGKASYWDVVEPFWQDVSIYKGTDVFLEQFSRLPQSVGDLYAAHWLVSEVVNGAFPQFFSNSTGVLAPEALSALRRMDLEDAADVLEYAMEYFGDEYPRDRSIRSEMIDWVWDGDLNEDQQHNLDLMLEISGEFLDSIGKDQKLFHEAADSYTARYLASV